MKNTAHRLVSSRRSQDSKGFTLVELLVVIAIIAILAAVVVLIINPLELIRRSHDAARLSDLANLQQAINVAVQESSQSGTQVLCAPPSTAPCQSTSLAGTRIPDGTGWVKVNFKNQNSVSVPTLPVDPINSGNFIYTYASDGVGWELTAVLESAQQSPRMANDGGDDPNHYEVGTNLNIIP